MSPIELASPKSTVVPAGKPRKRSDRRGVAALEFAILAPTFALMLLGTVDLVVWMRSWLRMESTAAEVANMISLYYDLYSSDFSGTFYPVAQDIAGSLSLGCAAGSNGNIIISGINVTGGVPKITWQMAKGTCTSSRIGTTGGTATLPAGYVPPSNIGVIMVEVTTTSSAFILSTALLGSSAGNPSTIGSFAVLPMRTGSLPTIQSGTRPS